jgi:hypothetical protein
MGLNNEKESCSGFFREVQKPNQILIFITLIAMMWFSSPILSIMFDQVTFKMFLSFLFYIFLFLISLSIKLITEVREEGVMFFLILIFIRLDLFLLRIFEATKLEILVDSGIMIEVVSVMG